MKGSLYTFLFVFLACSCKQNNAPVASANAQSVKFNIPDSSKTDVASDTTDLGAIWLKSIFQCKDASTYCFYLGKEKKLCTRRFYHFMEDSEAIFGASNLTDKEYDSAVKKYKAKWTKIYPLRDGQEPWLFGRGNDDAESIKEVRVKKISGEKYYVYVDFGFANPKTESEVTLVPFEKKYKIDYCQTKFLD